MASRSSKAMADADTALPGGTVETIKKSQALLAPVMKAIATAMGPHCEVVLHDLSSRHVRRYHTIRAMENPHVTGRSVGGPSTNLGLQSSARRSGRPQRLGYRRPNRGRAPTPLLIGLLPRCGRPRHRRAVRQRRPDAAPTRASTDRNPDTRKRVRHTSQGDARPRHRNRPRHPVRVRSRRRGKPSPDDGPSRPPWTSSRRWISKAHSRSAAPSNSYPRLWISDGLRLPYLDELRKAAP